MSSCSYLDSATLLTPLCSCFCRLTVPQQLLMSKENRQPLQQMQQGQLTASALPPMMSMSGHKQQAQQAAAAAASAAALAAATSLTRQRSTGHSHGVGGPTSIPAAPAASSAAVPSAHAAAAPILRALEEKLADLDSKYLAHKQKAITTAFDTMSAVQIQDTQALIQQIVRRRSSRLLAGGLSLSGCELMLRALCIVWCTACGV